MKKIAKNTIQIRQEREKELLIEKLRKTPIVQVACQQVGIGRATYYRWRKENKEFTKTVDEAIEEGNKMINDMAESQLISLIREKNMTGITFWLRHHHSSYANKLEITGHLRHSKEELTPEEKALIRKALRLALPPAKKDEKTKGKKEETNIR